MADNGSMNAPLPRSDLPAILFVAPASYPRVRAPLEIGIAYANGERYSCVVKPDAAWLSDGQRAHAASPDDLALISDCGLAVEDVATRLNASLYGETLYSDAWGLDAMLLERLYHASGMRPAFELEPLSDLLSATQRTDWAMTKLSICDALGDVRPRASIDALVVQLAFAKLCGADVSYSLACVSELDEHCKQRLVSLVPLRFAKPA